ncbi:MAG: NAD(P)/FAD-dependent oxidoreductase [Flavobacteriales bacterium]|nr:NAD(P)/FAD-dependent oxidoreductase [Flavobacteriales bacterium]
MDIPDINKPRVIIVGGGFGGIELAKSLGNTDVQVVMLDKHNYHTFQPLLYQVATSALEADSIAYPIRKIFDTYPNFYFRMGEVKEVLPDENKIITSINQISYDYLVIATGAQTNYYGNEGLIISAMPMKSIPEALDLRSLILQNFEKALVISNKRKQQSLMNFVIAGGGPTGVELAGALGELKQNILPKDYPELDLSQMNIYLIHSRERLLPMLSESSSEKTKKYLEELGVTVVLNTRVLDFHGDYVQTNQEEDYIAKTLIWTAGVEGAPIDGLNAINKGNRIVVNEFNQVKGYENIFAIGDVASMETNDTHRGHPMVAPVAMQQGKHLAKNISLLLENKNPIPFQYKNKGSMATIGKNKAVVEIGKTKMSGFSAWMVWMVVHLISLVGFRNKIIATINWVKNYFSSDRGIRLIITPFVLSKAKRKRRKEFEEDIEKAE